MKLPACSSLALLLHQELDLKFATGLNLEDTMVRTVQASDYNRQTDGDLMTSEWVQVQLNYACTTGGKHANTEFEDQRIL